jgi:hypothetical protein
MINLECETGPLQSYGMGWKMIYSNEAINIDPGQDHIQMDSQAIKIQWTHLEYAIRGLCTFARRVQRTSNESSF